MGEIIPMPALPGQTAVGLASLVDGIGTEDFGSRLVSLLHSNCGADHCAVFRLEHDHVSVMVSGSMDPARSATPLVDRYMREALWRKDPAISMARDHLNGSTPCLIRLDLNDMGYSALRLNVYAHVRDRVMLCGKRNGVVFGLSVVRTRADTFGSPEIEQLGTIADTLLSAMGKHVEVLRHNPNVASALSNLGEIEDCLVARSALTRREMEVCARVLYGLSSTGVALDLGIGEESVKTYRKRAYQRLSIGSERELLHWYLAQWSAWRGHLYAPALKTLH